MADDPFAPPSHDPNHYVNGETTFHFVLVLFLTCLDSCVLRSCFIGFCDPSGVAVRLR